MSLCPGKCSRSLLASLWLMVALACGHAAESMPADLQVDAGMADTSPRPRVILMIGDGMGQGQLQAARMQEGYLAMEALPSRSEVVTASLSGVTDSAAAATALATGELTLNGFVGLDAAGRSKENLVELAKSQGLHTGIVTTSYLSHATPAGFSAHCDSRDNLECIVADQIAHGADIMLGGGRSHFAPHRKQLEAQGYQIVDTGDELARASGTKLMGLFSEEHMSYVLDRAAKSSEPSLRDMSLQALRLLDEDRDGFFLMIEGARIDMASHDNDLERMRAETIAFDQAVQAVAEWAKTQEDVLLIVTADHECGGLSFAPGAQWRWGNHTNARVPLFALGPGSELLDGRILSHRTIYESMRASLIQEAPLGPAPLIVPDGRFGDLRVVATQTQPSDFGIGYNQLDALYLSANERGLAIGVEGLFEWERNAVAILIDRDFGSSTGIASLSGALSDHGQGVDALLSALRLTDPGIVGYGADLVVASRGGLETHQEEFLEDAGARGLVTPLGVSADLGWLSVASNFGEQVRVRDASVPTVGEGYEVLIPWQQIYPESQGAVPSNTEIGISAVLVGDRGDYTSNQALPPFADLVGSPGLNEIALPGIVVVPVGPATLGEARILSGSP